MSILDNFLASLVNRYRIKRGDLIYYKNYDFWQKRGFHLIPNHYYQPIPDTLHLPTDAFNKKTMKGVSFNDDSQLKTLNKLAKFNREYSQFKKLDKRVNTQKDQKFYFDNKAFDNIDALVYYGLIRLYKPKKIIEVGSGWSTKIAAQACIENKSTELLSIEPYPQPILENGFDGLTKLYRQGVQSVNLGLFRKLEDGDILFIDSSHVVKIGSDVNYLFFEVIPRLKKGVYVHFHDIFFPYDYPKKWVLEERRFWSEQYLLHALLINNRGFEVVLANNYLIHKYPQKLKNTFKYVPSLGGGSLWIRKLI